MTVEHRTPDDLEPLSDAELTALALAADVDTPVSDDAVAIWEVLGPATPSPLPSWYMPAPMGVRTLHGWRSSLVRAGAVSVIASLAVINACGLCNTYGQLHL